MPFPADLAEGLHHDDHRPTHRLGVTASALLSPLLSAVRAETTPEVNPRANNYSRLSASDAVANPKRTIVFIMSAPHAGSTLLDLILGSHPAAFSLGEVAAIQPHQRELCGVCSGPCPFWNSPAIEQLVAKYYAWRLLAPGLWRRIWARYGSARCNFYGALSATAGMKVLIDSSKDTWWIRRQLRTLWVWRDLQPLLIYLHRDGRAVINSQLRKYPTKNPLDAINTWMRHTRDYERLFRAFPPRRRFKVTYESLTQDPEQVVSNVCCWIGFEYTSEMLSYWSKDHHCVSGNCGTRSLIFRYREHFGAAPRTLPETRRAHYNRLGLAIRPDRRWEHELDSQVRSLFDRVAGQLNAEASTT